jgi:tryptophan-rich sensory protein
MGVSAYLVWAKRGLPPTKATIRTKGLWIFWVHLFFNALWSLLFFGLQSPLLALVDIAVLWVYL